MARPRRLLLTHVLGFASHLPGVFDGQPESIHDARVASRRVREVLPLAVADAGAACHLRRRFRRAGRALGAVRELDVHVELLTALERRLPEGAVAIALMRQQFQQERARRLRKLVKRLEQLDLPTTAASLQRQGHADAGKSSPLHAKHHWRKDLRAIVQDRGRRGAEAIEHATGVYFPNRLHATRVALKKLRYALEIADATRWRSHVAQLRELRRAQELLGQMHDRQMLLDALDAFGDDAGGPDIASQRLLVAGLLRAESVELHERYLARREALLAICRSEPRASRARIGAALSIGAVAASVGLATRRLTLVRRRPPAVVEREIAGPRRKTAS